MRFGAGAIGLQRQLKQNAQWDADMADRGQSAINRRLLLAGASGALGAGAAEARAARSRRKRMRQPLIVDALGGIDDPNLSLTRPMDSPVDTSQPDVDRRSVSDALASGLAAVNVTLGYVAGPDEPFEYSIKTIAAWERVVGDHSGALMKVLRAGDILKAKAAGKVGIIYGFQNAVQVADKPERIEIFRDLGVRVIQLTYNPANALGDGSMAPLNRGLTPLGREVVERLNASRIMVDLSHSGERTCLDAVAASAQPVSINHTGCRALVDLPRNKTDAELRGVAEKGGFVGIYFMPYLNASGHATAGDVVAHIEHAVNVCGEDHVGIGTDGSATAIDDLEAYRARLAQEVAERAKAGIGASGERADTYPFVLDLRGVDQFRKLMRLLAAKGWPEGRIEKIMGLNFLSYARSVWGA